MNKAVKIICKISEIAMWITTAVMLLLTILTVVAPQQLAELLKSGMDGAYLSINGLECEIIYEQSGLLMQPVALILFIASIISGTLGAMIFRNIYLVFKLSEGNSKHSKGVTPFQPDNVRMIREIGIFAISIPIIQFIASIAIHLVSGIPGTAVLSVGGIFFGIVILALSRIFQYGADLEKDAEGLI
ncbi:MAG: DUF2975 domain-containing protein [Ruminococcus sp.]|nr:DUF2975 domain-containing protein [Ruminococcus sp.]